MWATIQPIEFIGVESARAIGLGARRRAHAGTRSGSSGAARRGDGRSVVCHRRSVASPASPATRPGRARIRRAIMATRAGTLAWERSTVADDVNALAQEYFDYLLTAWPTWGHLMGNYEHADLLRRREPGGRGRGDPASGATFADRAEAIPGDGLSAQDRITREMIVVRRPAQRRHPRRPLRGVRGRPDLRPSRPGLPGATTRSCRSRTPTSPRR